MHAGQIRPAKENIGRETTPCQRNLSIHCSVYRSALFHWCRIGDIIGANLKFIGDMIGAIGAIIDDNKEFIGDILYSTNYDLKRMQLKRNDNF